MAGATGYYVYRNSKLIKTISSGSTVKYTDVAANTNGTKYIYKVVAYAKTGKSTLSNSVTIYRVARPAISSLKNTAAGKATAKQGPFCVLKGERKLSLCKRQTGFSETERCGGVCFRDVTYI